MKVTGTNQEPLLFMLMTLIIMMVLLMLMPMILTQLMLMLLISQRTTCEHDAGDGEERREKEREHLDNINFNNLKF